jgi:hypothetical protein
MEEAVQGYEGILITVYADDKLVAAFRQNPYRLSDTIRDLLGTTIGKKLRFTGNKGTVDAVAAEFRYPGRYGDEEDQKIRAASPDGKGITGFNRMNVPPADVGDLNFHKKGQHQRPLVGLVFFFPGGGFHEGDLPLSVRVVWTDGTLMFRIHTPKHRRTGRWNRGNGTFAVGCGPGGRHTFFIRGRRRYISRPRACAGVFHEAAGDGILHSILRALTRGNRRAGIGGGSSGISGSG